MRIVSGAGAPFQARSIGASARRARLPLWFALILPCAAFAQAVSGDTLPAPVQKVLAQHGIPAAGVSVFVQEVGAATPLLAVAADEPRNPASTIKLLTTFVALNELGPAYTWKTEAYASGPIKGGRLEGDLYLKGYGDPQLVIEQFWQLLRGIRRAGVEEIAGDLVLDTGRFATESGDPADFDGQPHRAYNVLPSALLLNFQAVQFFFRPDAETQRVRVVAEPALANLDIDNQMTLTGGRCGAWNSAIAIQIQRNGTRDRVGLSGSYPSACGENSVYRVVAEADSYMYGAFRALWQEQGGRFGGKLRRGEVPAQARLLHTHTSPPLSDILRGINKFSNNVMTRQLLLTLAAEKKDPPGTSANGRAVVRAWLKRHGMHFPELVLDNGAGLSREARISARHLGELLLAAHKSPYMPEFVSSLPIAAVDGTLRKRFNGNAMEGRMHIKTGLLDYVRGSAGYVSNRKGQTLVVVCLHNHPAAHTGAGERVQDALLKWAHDL